MIANGIGQLIVGILNALAQYAPQIVDSLFQFIIGVLYSLSAHIPDFIQALVGVFSSVFSGVASALGSMEAGTIGKALLGIGLLSGVLAALSAIVVLIPSAMVGVLGIGAIIAELALVLAAIGGLSQIPGLSWLIGEGGQLLSNIGTAIGSFVGSIVGGFASGVTSQFAQIGTDLSNFMVNLQPFIDGAQNIDESLMNGVKNIASAILLITGAGIVEGIASFITGRNSVADFANQLTPLAEGLVSFGETLGPLTPDAINKIRLAAEASKALAEFASAVPNEGGLVSKFTGENSLSVFGEELAKFGPSLQSYSDSISGINTEAITASANAMSAIVAMAQAIPNEGGLVSKFTGDNSLSKFGVELAAFGPSLKTFGDSVNGLNTDAIAASANAMSAIVEMSQAIPNEGGLVSKFTGDNALSKFGAELQTFGPQLKSYGDNVNGLNTEAITASANAMSAIVAMAQAIPNEGGLVSKFTGDNSLSKFGAELQAFGPQLKSYGENINGANIESISSTITVLKSLSSTELDTSKLNLFANSLKEFGKKLGEYSQSISAGNVSPDAVRESAFAVQTIAGVAGNIPDTANLISFGDNLTKLGGSVSNYMDDIKDVDAGQISSTTQAIVDMVNSLSNLDTSRIDESAVAFVSNFLTAIQSATPQAQGAGAVLGQGVALGLLSAGSLANASGASLGQAGASGASGMSGAYSLVGSTLGFGLVSGLFASSGAVGASGSSAAFAGVTGAQSQSAAFNSMGLNLGNGLANGMRVASGSVSGAGSAIGQAGVSGARGQISGFSSIGSSMAAGLATGIRSGASYVISAAVSLASSALSAARNVLKINSPSKAFIALGNSIGEGLANGIYDSTWKAVYATEDMTKKVSDVAKKSFEDVEKWIETAKHFDELSLAEELQIWESVISRYAEGSEEWLKANKNAYTIAKEIRDQDYQDAIDHINKEKNYNRMSIDEEIAAYEELLAKYADYSEKREEIEETLYDLRHEKIDNSLDLLNDEIVKQEELIATIEEGTEEYRIAVKELEHLKDLQREASLSDGENWISEQKAYDRLTSEEELAAYYRQLAKTTEGSEAYKDILQKIYDLKIEMSDGDIDFIRQEISAFNDLISTLQNGTPEYENACKDRLNWQNRLTEALLKDSEKWLKLRDKYGRAGGLSEELADNMRVLRRTIAETPWDTATIEQYQDNVYDVMKEIYDTYEQYQDNIKKAQEDYEADRIELEQEKADKIKEINEQLEQDIADTDAKYYDELESRTKSLYDSYDLFDEVSAKKEVNPETLMKNLQDQVNEFNDWSDLLDQLSARGLNSDLIDELQEMGPSAIAEIRALTQMSDSELGQYATLWSTKHEEAKKRATAELEDLRIETQSQIQALRDQADIELAEYNKTWNEKMSELEDSLNRSLDDLETDFKKSVGLIKTDTVSEFNEMVNTVIPLMKNAGWSETGQEIVSGLVSGIEMSSGDFVTAMENLWNSGLSAFKSQGEIHSPSKVFIRLGRFIDEGLVIGIRNYSERVANASSGIGRAAIDSMCDVIGRISDVINGNIEVDPTIRPVLDLTDITSGLNQMDNVLMANRGMRLGMDVAGGIQNGNSYMDHLFAKIADSNVQSCNRITDAIDGLKSDFAGLVDKVSHLQMVVDSGALVGAITPQIDRKLNIMSVMKRRGTK